MEKLSDVFRKLLVSRGIDKVGTLSKRVPKRDTKDRLQDIAIHVLEGYGYIGKVEEPTAIAWDLENGTTKDAIYAFIPKNLAHRFEAVITAEDIKKAIPEWPYFIVDLMHWDKHTQKEKGKVCLQLAQCYGLLRDYFTGDRLAVTWANEEFREMANMPLDKVTLHEGPTTEFLKSEGIDEVVLLDPWADEVLSEEDFGVRAFIIGGIVDTGGTKKKTTPKIGEELEAAGIKVRRRKIVLRGDIVGVPDRINHILEILLRMMVEGKDMDEAVYDVQSPLHARWRLRKELPKHATRYMINGKVYRVVEKELFDEYSKWLKIRWEDFVKVLRELNLVALERKRMHHLNKISNPRIINGKAYRVILLKKAAMLCYNC
ncbi:tRNA (guanine-N2)-dimethyltransferase [Thermococcus sp. CX2]|uniref:tRNA (guanine(9)-/adenine(9)-N1)-methyltransferase n=1 Tax=Thermococcus sp. CX2 TaxID=163006 RepID=UPI001438CD7E|nr:tRNA (guanine(9)-/adenine(9)-N1)-methyltransferase [Thermococcus sp. CX2]NJE84406.1 tRNA (guanine-N2)-dimethyltransferase [Thermococcus sp. CX2]